MLQQQPGDGHVAAVAGVVERRPAFLLHREKATPGEHRCESQRARRCSRSVLVVAGTRTRSVQSMKKPLARREDTSGVSPAFTALNRGADTVSVAASSWGASHSTDGPRGPQECRVGAQPGNQAAPEGSDMACRSQWGSSTGQGAAPAGAHSPAAPVIQVLPSSRPQSRRRAERWQCHGVCAHQSAPPRAHLPLAVRSGWCEAPSSSGGGICAGVVCPPCESQRR